LNGKSIYNAKRIPLHSFKEKRGRKEETIMVETPSYNVEKKEDSFEIRAYASYVIAQVDVESDFDGALV